MNERLIREAAILDELIWNEYKPESGNENTKVPRDYRAFMFLETDLESIATNVSEERFDELVEKYIDASPLADEIREKIDFSKIRKAAETRKDWGKALKSVKNGTDLSGIISWSFSDKDISELAKLHKANKYREKIEDLLEDCNFHAECGAFADGRYDKYLNDTKPEEDPEQPVTDTDERSELISLKERLSLTFEEAQELIDNSYDDRDIEWTVVYEDFEDLGRSEASSIGLESWTSKYFDYKSFGEDVFNRDEKFYKLQSGRIVAR